MSKVFENLTPGCRRNRPGESVRGPVRGDLTGGGTSLPSLGAGGWGQGGEKPLDSVPKSGVYLYHCGGGESAPLKSFEEEGMNESIEVTLFTSSA